MLSAVIPSVHSYAALPLARQLLHQRYVHPGPLVLGTNPLNIPTPTADRDRTVSRRSRSEERRVGKECRSRWSPYPEKKKKDLGRMRGHTLTKQRPHRRARAKKD